jgi:hypothetical protein
MMETLFKNLFNSTSALFQLLVGLMLLIFNDLKKVLSFLFSSLPDVIGQSRGKDWIIRSRGCVTIMPQYVVAANFSLRRIYAG